MQDRSIPLLKSKIFLKAMFIVSSMIIIFSLSISFFSIPKVENSIKNLEEKNAKETLQNIVIIVNNVHKELKTFREFAVQKYKHELTSLTDSIWSIIQTKYNQSKPENIGIVLEDRAYEFKSNLIKFYNNNRNKMNEKELKKMILSYINIYRYNDETGYFWVNDFQNKMIMHPTIPELNGTFVGNIKDSNGVSVFAEIMDIIQKNNSGLLSYKWMNPKTKKEEDKISYVFVFEPYNWVIGTGEYYSVLKNRLQNEVFDIVSKARYDKVNYFFLSDYNNIALSHPYDKGVDFSKIKDKKGKLIVPPMIKIAREKGEGFHSYWWKKNPKEDTLSKKLTFVKDFPAWEIVIGTGIYTDELEKELEKRKEALIKQLREVIFKTRLGRTGYLYIFNKKGKMLIHPNKNLDGNEKFHTLSNPTGNTLIYDDLVNASKTKDKSFYYKWDKLTDKGNYIYDKVSWVEYIPELDWYIGSSVYIDEFKESSKNLRDFILMVSFIILILSLTYSFIFFRNLLTPIATLSELSLKVSKGDYSTRYTIKHGNDEVGILADKFNEMVTTIEHKTDELEESNDELEQSITNLKMTRDKLVESEKMASLGGLVAGVAHEINTPVGIGVTGITYFLEITNDIQSKYHNDNMSQEEFEKYLDTSKELGIQIHINLERTADLVRSFKQISVDQTSEERREFYLKEYVSGVLVSISNITKKTNLKINVDCDDKLKLKSYPGAFSQIISNLIINSIRHGFEEKEKGVITISVTQKIDSIQLSYKDNGKGVPLENINKIFNPFFTTNRKDGGTGLGLNILYNIITSKLNGTITCNSEEGKGIEFIINIPI